MHNFCRYRCARAVPVFVALFFALSWPAAHAEVLHAEDSGFVVRHERTVLAPPETAWRMLVGHVAEWWHPEHTYGGDAASLYIEARPLGCFCERMGPNDVVVHMTVTMLRENRLLRLTGGLGPLGMMGVDGNLLVESVVLNYLALHGEQASFETLFPNHGLGNVQLRDSLTAFNPIL